MNNGKDILKQLGKHNKKLSCGCIANKNSGRVVAISPECNTHNINNRFG